MSIPFVDLKAQYAAIKNEIDRAVTDVIESTRFIGGERLESFEKNFAAYCEADIGVGTSSGTSAIQLALLALGIGAGDEVITACNTFIATTEAISHTGARPVLVDVRPDTLTIDPARAEDAVTPRTRAIVPVHLYGQSADMDAIRDIAERRGLAVVADAAQAHGARYKGSRKGTLGVATCYSFYPGKNLGAYGDGGIVVTDDAALAERVRLLVDHGRHGKYTHKIEGFNHRLDALQAAILDVKLRHLDGWNERRRSHAQRYTEALAGSAVRPVEACPDCEHVYHLYVVRTTRREALMGGLSERGIACGIHYPVPLPLQQAYKRLGHARGDFPAAEKAADEIVSLPMYAELSDEMVDQVIEAVRQLAG